MTRPIISWNPPPRRVSPPLAKPGDPTLWPLYMSLFQLHHQARNWWCPCYPWRASGVEIRRKCEPVVDYYKTHKRDATIIIMLVYGRCHAPRFDGHMYNVRHLLVRVKFNYTVSQQRIRHEYSTLARGAVCPVSFKLIPTLHALLLLI